MLRITRAEDLDTLAPEAAEAARYVLLSHDDDGVALFSPELLLRSPEWLGPDRPAVVPPQAAWSIPITFLQTAIDMKNAMNVVPGEFVASGHDYRADLARAVRFAYGLSCTRRPARGRGGGAAPGGAGSRGDVARLLSLRPAGTTTR